MRWQDLAACAGNPLPLWDESIDGESLEQRAARHGQARRVCASCLVRPECNDDRMQNHAAGIWGGVLHASWPRKRPAVDDRPEPDHGTASGATWHETNREPMCQPCRAFRARQRAEQRARQRQRDADTAAAAVLDLQDAG